MTISYSLAPMPKWYIADLVGRPLGAGSMYTYRSLDKTEFKFVFQDASGNFPWTDPVLFDENGSQGPFYWETDSLNPQETYYIEVYDSDGVLQWTIDGYGPTGGGGGTVTTALDLDNMIVNNVMWRNIGATANPIASTVTLLAPGAHAALTTTAANARPDVYFLKNNTAATDQITFIPFPLGSNALTGDVTPVDYLNYACTNAPVGETFKYVQYAITQGVQNLSNQNVTVTIWARGNSGTTTLTLQWRQFFGDGAGASPDEITPIQTINLTGAWTKTILQTPVPDVSGKVLGGCGNSALFLQVQYPLGVACNIDFTKPAVYVGNIAPQEDYQTYDIIDGVINAQRTGFIMSGFNLTAPLGYVIMNDGSIGNAASSATTRANIDTFPLYNLLYDNVSDTYAPVSGGRTGSSINDFVAGKRLTLTRQLGRLLGCSGSGAGLTTRVLGEFLGSETISVSAMPAHAHAATAGTGGFVLPTTAGGGSIYTTGTTGTVGNTANTGGSAADGNMPPSSFMSFFIKL